MAIRTTSRGDQKIEVVPPEGSRLDIVSVNWCDRTTWYPNSIKVTDETLSSDVLGYTFSPSVSRPWIDVTHGKLTGETQLRAEYTPVIEVDGVPFEENSPDQTDKDYSIDYDTGDVTFNSSQLGKTVVAKSYYYENGSEWIIAPTAGKLLRLTDVEVQFSADIDLTDTVIFQAYGLVDYFAPQLLDTASPPGPYPSGTKIPIGDPSIYQTMQDYVNEASGSYPQIPQLGGSSWRGMNSPLHIFRWPYKERTTTDLYASSGMEIRISLESDNVFGGDSAVATFYGKSEDE